MKLQECLIVIAHPDELNDNFKKLPNLVLTGVGKVNATYYLTKAIMEQKQKGNPIKYVINMGSAGSKKYKKGSLVSCTKFIQRDMDCTAFGVELGRTPSDKFPTVLEVENYAPNLPTGTCGTGDSFVTIQTLDARIDVVEMEAYALARVCKIEEIKFVSVKYISDGLQEDGGNEWVEDVKNSADVMFEYLSTHLLEGNNE